MLKWANKTAQPIADEVETVDYEVTVADGTGGVSRGATLLYACGPQSVLSFDCDDWVHMESFQCGVESGPG